MTLNKQFTKKVQRSEELFIQFTEEELKALNIKGGDKFSWKVDGENLILKKHVAVDVNITEWSREVLEMLIKDSIEQDISVNDVICNLLDKYTDAAENNDK